MNNHSPAFAKLIIKKCFFVIQIYLFNVTRNIWRVTFSMSAKHDDIHLVDKNGSEIALAVIQLHRGKESIVHRLFVKLYCICALLSWIDSAQNSNLFRSFICNCCGPKYFLLQRLDLLSLFYILCIYSETFFRYGLILFNSSDYVQKVFQNSYTCIAQCLW